MIPALSQFRTEIRHFYLVSLLNLAFSALAIAFGVMYIITAVLGLSASPAMQGLRMLTGVIAMVCFGLGLSWLLSTLKVFEGVEKINDDLGAEGTAITDDRLTCLIVQMLAHYRDNRRTISTMILVCTLGGLCFFLLGIATSLEVLTLLPGGMDFTLDNSRVIPPMLLSLGIALASLLSSYFFTKITSTWNRRLHEIEASECALKKTLGLDEQ